MKTGHDFMTIVMVYFHNIKTKMPQIHDAFYQFRTSSIKIGPHFPPIPIENRKISTNLHWCRGVRRWQTGRRQCRRSGRWRRRCRAAARIGRSGRHLHWAGTAGQSRQRSVAQREARRRREVRLAGHGSLHRAGCGRHRRYRRRRLRLRCRCKHDGPSIRTLRRKEKERND